MSHEAEHDRKNQAQPQRLQHQHGCTGRYLEDGGVERNTAWKGDTSTTESSQEDEGLQALQLLALNKATTYLDQSLLILCGLVSTMLPWAELTGDE